MPVHYDIWVPAVLLAHGVGILLLLYSVEKVSGVLSQTWSRFFGRRRTGDASVMSSTTFTRNAHKGDAGGGDRKALAKADELGRVEGETGGPAERHTSSWVRGCACTVGLG